MTQRIVPPKGGSGTTPPGPNGWRCPGCRRCYSPAVLACPARECQPPPAANALTRPDLQRIAEDSCQ